jgi:hypothetical protein
VGTGEWLEILQQFNNSQSPDALVINATQWLVRQGESWKYFDFAQKFARILG